MTTAHFDDPRHLARRVALKKLFWLRAKKAADKFAGETASTQSPVPSLQFPSLENPEPELTKKIVRGVSENRDKIDKIIEEGSPDWELSMMENVDLAILEIAVYEAFLGGFTPKKAAINEAVELAKEFGGADSPKFVNGVLGAVMDKFGDDDGKEDKQD